MACERWIWSRTKGKVNSLGGEWCKYSLIGELFELPTTLTVSELINTVFENKQLHVRKLNTSRLFHLVWTVKEFFRSEYFKAVNYQTARVQLKIEKREGIEKHARMLRYEYEN